MFNNTDFFSAQKFQSIKSFQADIELHDLSILKMAKVDNTEFGMWFNLLIT